MDQKWKILKNPIPFLIYITVAIFFSWALTIVIVDSKEARVRVKRNTDMKVFEIVEDLIKDNIIITDSIKNTPTPLADILDPEAKATLSTNLMDFLGTGRKTNLSRHFEGIYIMRLQSGALAVYTGSSSDAQRMNDIFCNSPSPAVFFYDPTNGTYSEGAVCRLIH